MQINTFFVFLFIAEYGRKADYLSPKERDNSRLWQLATLEVLLARCRTDKKKSGHGVQMAGRKAIDRKEDGHR